MKQEVRNGFAQNTSTANQDKQTTQPMTFLLENGPRIGTKSQAQESKQKAPSLKTAREEFLLMSADIVRYKPSDILLLFF